MSAFFTRTSQARTSPSSPGRSQGRHRVLSLGRVAKSAEVYGSLQRPRPGRGRRSSPPRGRTASATLPRARPRACGTRRRSGRTAGPGGARPWPGTGGARPAARTSTSPRSCPTRRWGEQVWVSYDAGESWNDETYDLRAATGAIGQIRPSALLFVPVSDGLALLVGASNGVYVQKKKSWTRLGACSELPQVLVAGLSYEADVLVAATMGRGVYVMHNVSSVLDKVLS